MKGMTAWVAIAVLLCTSMVRASDHRESPAIEGNPAADITDFYAFLNPKDPSRLVLVMGVSPASTPQISRTYQFSAKTRYLFKIDSNGDYLADRVIDVRFSKPEFPKLSNTGALIPGQHFRADFGFGLPEIRGAVTPLIQASLTPPEPLVFHNDVGIKMFTGPRDDPFFFDSTDSFRVLNKQQPKFEHGIDRNAGLNINAIVIEMPLALVYRGVPLHMWVTTEEEEADASGKLQWRQIQRDANPAVKAVYIPPEYLDSYNASEPVDDKKNFAAIIGGSAKYLFSISDQDLAKYLSIVTPDEMTLDPTKPIKMPNGRTLDDDIDLMFWFNLYKPLAYAPGDLDGVHANDVPNLKYFPYLAPPHTVPKP